ncbi:hypothetical protein [Alkalibacterium pelagium]|uniref:hypothetical protein n=1 Tax=Alkalibacterium pelagium TaxID=426702 RepID=UPI001FE48073|nr:hypothetical protein [Alkalibacterium pelagium]
MSDSGIVSASDGIEGIAGSDSIGLATECWKIHQLRAGHKTVSLRFQTGNDRWQCSWSTGIAGACMHQDNSALCNT